jgi:hypothetical protein
MAMSGYTPEDCYGEKISDTAWICTLVAEGIVERAFGLNKGTESPSGRRYLQYGPLWSESLARKMLDMNCPNWFYAVNPHRVEQRKPLCFEDAPKDCTWVPGLGLYPSGYLKRALEINQRGSGFTSTDEDLQRNEGHFYGMLTQALGPAGVENNASAFSHRKPKWKGFLPFAFGTSFRNGSETSADWINFADLNLWSGKNPGAEPLLNALASIPTAIHRRSAGDIARAISSSVWKKRDGAQT